MQDCSTTLPKLTVSGWCSASVKAVINVRASQDGVRWTRRVMELPSQLDGQRHSHSCYLYLPITSSIISKDFHTYKPTENVPSQRLALRRGLLLGSPRFNDPVNSMEVQYCLEMMMSCQKVGAIDLRLTVLKVPTATYFHFTQNQSSSPISWLPCSICATKPSKSQWREMAQRIENWVSVVYEVCLRETSYEEKKMEKMSPVTPSWLWL